VKPKSPELSIPYGRETDGTEYQTRLDEGQEGDKLNRHRLQVAPAPENRRLQQMLDQRRPRVSGSRRVFGGSSKKE